MAYDFYVTRHLGGRSDPAIGQIATQLLLTFDAVFWLRPSSQWPLDTDHTVEQIAFSLLIDHCMYHEVSSRQLMVKLASAEQDERVEEISAYMRDA